ncbi:XRE family transcriptional regulator [Campylobacter devanensis]|uniref:XRE family transcriptional regulator n=1 Tax=Campylobacter devanensis TaxID=3161138 RepID=UPI000A33E193|nr:XRE family transcriptional regulator [Campylobacter sp. P0087]
MIGNKIRTLREENGISQKEFAKELGIAYGTLQSYEYGTTKPKTDFIERLAEKFKIDVSYFYDDCRQYVANMSPISLPNNKNMSSICRQSSDNLSINRKNLKKSHDSILINIKDDTVYVPFFKDGAVSAGFGTEDFGNDCDFLPFKKQDLRLMFGAHSTAHIGVIPCIGNSMQPTIEEGELIVFQCDGSQNEGAIYVIRFEGELFVKRLKKRPLQLVSDNKDYEPIEPQADQELEIIGRVIGSYSINSKRF